VDIELLSVHDLQQDKIPQLLSGVDVLILTSLFEGSPNVIKEAMACNCPIVSTDVGDVREVFGGIDGCYVSGPDPQDFAEKILEALSFNGRTAGRERIYYLDSEKIAKKISRLYKEVLGK
jgi:glycosyltransferase involved in cell wall biosynthesis